ncbi:Poly(A)-specific ribonuclease PARN [Chelonia mydas]|uniref:Poly(A)-specific ribonuclease PARN n=1 Tax=Chelonia mydas TaxID=8469 RepID=M7BHI0_CHEMY|nr:Poly(A)-specific ribonuclease PARN [Chelonia mydas]
MLRLRHPVWPAGAGCGHAAQPAGAAPPRPETFSPGPSQISFTATSTMGKRSMSPIQEETGSDDMEEREIEETELDETDCYAESVPEGRKRAKKFKKVKKEQDPTGWSSSFAELSGIRISQSNQGSSLTNLL